MSIIFHPLRVRAIEPDTQEAVIVTFDVPEELRDVFGFTQGQYLTLRKDIDGQDLRRSYSICAGVDDAELRVGVRKVKGGVFSNWINEHLKPGDAISVMAPQGRFFVPLDAESHRHHLGIAGGSGITPILSIMKTVLAREPASRFTLIYGNRSLRSTMFKEEIEDLKNRYMTRLVLQHVFSDEHTDSPLNRGVMDRAKIAEFLEALVPARQIDHAYICGPFQMNDEAEAALLAAGVPPERIHIERFGIALQDAAKVGAILHEAQAGDAQQARIVIVRDGLSRDFGFSKGQPSILDAASAAGLEVPFSCTSGVCGTCRAKLMEGEVRMERNFALDKQEVADGFVLTCQSHPLTERVVLSFDALKGRRQRTGGAGSAAAAGMGRAGSCGKDSTTIVEITMSNTLQSFIAGRWIGREGAQELRSAINGKTVASTHAEAIDFGEAVEYAKRVGLPALLALDFQQRAQRLKALAKYLNEHKEQLYELSAHTGATRSDGWIDIEGGTGTLYAYAGIGGNELPSGNLVHEGPAMPLGKKGGFAGTHILVPRGGVAVHINAFNFPVWGLLEKFAPSFLAGMPCIGKPASATSYLTEAAVRLMTDSGILPEGSLQLVIGSTGDLLDRLDGQDVVSFTGSADTAASLRVHPNIVRQSVSFNAEADSLNCAILAPDVTPDDEEFDLFVKEVAREITIKAGQKCTAIRRAIVPRQHLDAVAEKLKARLAKTVVGDPSRAEVRMGALASHGQRKDVAEQVATLLQGAELVFGERDGFNPVGEGVADGSFFSPTLLLSRKPLEHDAVHEVEAFGPVSTLMAYDGLDEALQLAAKGRGSLVGTLVTRDPAIAARVIPIAAALHGRLLILDREAAAESTGHGSPLPSLKHGGPGRAGGGEELGGIRAVKHYLQRAAVQGSPTMLAAVTGEHVRGAALRESELHPFRRWFEDLQVGDSLLTHRRTVSEADIVAFGGISGDYFYMHFDEIAAKETQFGKRIAHGYFVLSAAAGLFVSPAPGPVLANYGLDTLRFIKPVGIGDTIRARLTCKRKTDRGRTDDKGQGQGVVAWDVEVTNQDGELVASYDILTLVAKRPTQEAALLKA